MRALVFLVAFTVLAAAMFPELHALARRGPLAAYPWDLLWFLLHVPVAVVAALLMAHAQLFSRLAPNPAWYVLLTLLAAAHLCIPFLPVDAWNTPAAAVLFAKPALLVVVVMVLLRTRPRAGHIYAGEGVPGVRVFIGFTLLLAMSFAAAQGFLGLPGVVDAVGLLPAGYETLILSPIVVALFIAASRIRHRRLQPSPGPAWLLWGIVVWALGEIAARATAIVAAGPALIAPYLDLIKPYLGDIAIAAYWLGLAAHAMLFVGAFQLLCHLLPRRPEDEAA